MKKRLTLTIFFCLVVGMLTTIWGKESNRPPAQGQQKLTRSNSRESTIKPITTPFPEAPPGIDHSITSAEYSFVLDDKRVRCVARFGVTVFPTDKLPKVQLLKGEISPESITANGKARELTPIDGWLCFLPESDGSFTMEVEFSLKPRVRKGMRSISFNTPISAVNRVRLKSEKPRLVRSTRLTHSQEVGEIETTLAFLPGDTLELEWGEVPPEVKRSPLFAVAPDIFYLFEGPYINVSARLATTVHSAPAKSARLSVPSSAKKVEVSGPAVKRFSRKGTEVTVDFKGKVEGRTDIFVSFNYPIRNRRKPTLLPVPSINGARISGGAIAVSCPSDSDLILDEVLQAEEIALFEIPKALKALMTAQPILAFRIRGASPQVSVQSMSLKSADMLEVLADRADFTSFRSLTGEEIVKVALSVRNEKRQFLRVSLPDGARMLRCLVSGKEVVVGQDGAEGDLLIPLERSIETIEGAVSFPLEFIYSVKQSSFAGKNSTQLELPSIDIPIAQATWTAYMPTSIRTRSASGNVTLLTELEEPEGMLEFGRGYQKPDGAAKPPSKQVQAAIMKERFQRSLVRNYWVDANEAYKRQDYDEARRNLRVLFDDYSGNDFEKDARQLMKNIDMIHRRSVVVTTGAPTQPPQQPTSRPQQQKAKRIQRQVAATQFRAELKQEKLIAAAEVAEQQGLARKSIKLLEEAGKMSEAMIGTGARVQEQRAITRAFSGKLSRQKGLVSTNIRLKMKHKELAQKLEQAEAGVSVATRFEDVLEKESKKMPQGKPKSQLEFFGDINTGVGKLKLHAGDLRDEKGGGGVVGPVVAFGEIDLDDESAPATVTGPPLSRIRGGGKSAREESISRRRSSSRRLFDYASNEQQSVESENVALEQEVERLESRLKVRNEIRGEAHVVTGAINGIEFSTSTDSYTEPPTEANKRQRARDAEIAAREVRRSIEAAKPLVALGKGQEAAKQVKTVTEYYRKNYRNKISSDDDLNNWDSAAKEAEEFIRKAGEETDLTKDNERRATLLLREGDMDRLGVSDEPMSKENRKEFLGAFKSNISYSASSAVPPPTLDISETTKAPKDDQVDGENVLYVGGHAGWDLLKQVSAHKGANVDISITSNRNISAEDIAAVGGKARGLAAGYYVVLDKAQVDALNEIRPPDISEPAPVRQNTFFVGNRVTMLNDERVQLARTEGRQNVLIVNRQEIKLDPNQYLLVSNQKGVSILNASEAVAWGEERPEETITQQGFSLDVPRVGREHLFKKLLLRAGEKLEVLIQYEEKGGVI